LHSARIKDAGKTFLSIYIQTHKDDNKLHKDDKAASLFNKDSHLALKLAADFHGSVNV